MWNLGHESYFGIALISLHSDAARGLNSALSVSCFWTWLTDFQAFSVIIIVAS